MGLKPIRYARPHSLAEAGSLLMESPHARPLLGGTDLLVGMRVGKVAPELVVDLKRVAELDAEITILDGELRVGARTTMSQLVRSPEVQRWFPALADAAAVVGSVQIRNRATLVGNVCNASPAADTVPPLLVYGSEVSLHGPGGVRRVPLDGLFQGPGKIDLQPGEVVVSLQLPIPRQPAAAVFARVTRRRGVDLASVNLCCRVDAEGRVSFGLGAVGPRPLLVVDESRRLVDSQVPEEERAQLLRQLLSVATPISDVRAGADYRRAMLEVWADRALSGALQRLSGGDTDGE